MNLYCGTCGQKVGDDRSIVTDSLPPVPEHFPLGRLQQSGVAASGGALVPICPGTGMRPWVGLGKVEPLLGDDEQEEGAA